MFYWAQVGYLSGTFWFDSSLDAWKREASDSATTPTTLSVPSLAMDLEPCCMVLPLGLSHVRAVLKHDTLPSAQIQAFKVEAVLHGAAVPVRLIPAPALADAPSFFSPLAEIALSASPQTNEDINSSWKGMSDSTALRVPCHNALNVEIDLRQVTTPGLLQINLWSSPPANINQVSSLMATNSVLLIHGDDARVADEINGEACGEELLADLAEVLLAASEEADIDLHPLDGTSRSRLSITLDVISDLLEWSRATGCENLERLLDSCETNIKAKLATIPMAAAALTTDSASDHVGKQAASYAPQAPVLPPVATRTSLTSDRSRIHLICWSMMQLSGLVTSAIPRSMTEGRGELSAMGFLLI